MNLLNGMFGGGGNIVEKADVAVEKLQGYKERMVSYRCATAVVGGVVVVVVVVVVAVMVVVVGGGGVQQEGRGQRTTKEGGAVGGRYWNGTRNVVGVCSCVCRHGTSVGASKKRIV